MSTALLSTPRTTGYDYVPVPTYCLTAPAEPQTARIVRGAVRGIAAAYCPALIETARVCVSDAVADVLRSVKASRMEVAVSADVARMTVLVRGDACPPVSRHREVRTSEAPGRRLTLVRRLSSTSGVTWMWGARKEVIGKQVWFELSVASAVAL
ncbi:hypothetical protein CTZ27_26395 [Streptomyces griseocarneus]|nr:hypothetical protein CTZ27_26395 [Streptomyces griseocarneus]